MTYAPTTTHLNAPFTNSAGSTGQIDLVSNTPDRAKFKQGKADRKFALVFLSCALIIAVGCIALVIGTSAAEAASLPVFTTAHALSAKQDASVAGIATASLAFIAFGALALFSSKKM